MPHTVVQLSKRSATELQKKRLLLSRAAGTLPCRREKRENVYSAMRVRETSSHIAAAMRLEGVDSDCPCYWCCSCTVGPVILTPVLVTQSVRNVWSPPNPLHHRVWRS
jgi:hypothetical protein